MTKHFMEFHPDRIDKQMMAQVHYQSGNWSRLSAQVFASGSFVADKEQNFWSSKQMLQAEGRTTMQIRFREERRAYEPFSLFELNPGEPDHFEFEMEMSPLQIPWFLAILDECRANEQVLAVHAITRDETRPGYREQHSNGRLFLRAHKSRITPYDG